MKGDTRMTTAEAKGALTFPQVMLVGIALFSMFFGAGNLILPPLLGVQAAADAPQAIAGFFVTGVGLPVLGIVAVALAGTLRELAGRVHPLFARVFVAAVYLAIGPCLAIPRTSSTAFEMLTPLVPEGISIGVARAVFSVLFFVVAYVLAMHPGRLTKLLGRVTGPALIVLIVAVVGSALLSPGEALTPARAPYQTGAALQGFLTGYQTMDLLASLTFGIVIATNIRSLGVVEPRGVMREVCRAGVVAGMLMMLIYGGLAVVGVKLCSSLASATNGAEVLTALCLAAFWHGGHGGGRRDLFACMPQCVHWSYQLLRYVLCAGAAACSLPRMGGWLRAVLVRGVKLWARCDIGVFGAAAQCALPGGDCAGAHGHGAPRVRRAACHVAVGRGRYGCGELGGEFARRGGTPTRNPARCPSACRCRLGMGCSRAACRGGGRRPCPALEGVLAAVTGSSTGTAARSPTWA